MDQYELEEKWISFTLLDQIYALPVLSVREIIPFRQPAPIPGAPSEVIGALDIRGDIVTVFLMRALLNQAISELDDGRIIIIETQRGQYGVCVDAMGDIFTLDSNAIDRSISSDSSQLTMGTAHQGDELIILIDTSRISSRLTL